jgi:hypothetical protein
MAARMEERQVTRPAHQHTQVDTAADDLRDMIRDLTRTTSHREQQVRPTAAGGTRTHFTKVPPLLDQLQWGHWTTGSDRSGAGYESRPAASIEALDTLVWIDLAAARWVRDLGEDDPPSTVECVRLLGGLLASAHRCDARRGEERGGSWCCTWHAVDHDVRRWWTQARLMTGWDAPAWRPDNTCPACGERRSLRLRLEDRIGFCTECRETWPPDAYQVLADHIRTESDARGPAVVGPCWCPWPLSRLQSQWRGRLFGMCPRCGSASCRHAVRQTRRRSM